MGHKNFTRNQSQWSACRVACHASNSRLMLYYMCTSSILVLYGWTDVVYWKMYGFYWLTLYILEENKTQQLRGTRLLRQCVKFHLSIIRNRWIVSKSHNGIAVCHTAYTAGASTGTLIAANCIYNEWSNNLTNRLHCRCTWIIQACSQGGANVHPDLMHASMDPPKSTTQMAA